MKDGLDVRVALLESRADSMEKQVGTVSGVAVPIARLEERVGLLTTLVLAELAAIIGLAGAILRSGVLK